MTWKAEMLRYCFLRMTMVVALIVPLPAHAEELADSLAACRGETDDAVRLSCYDAIRPGDDIAPEAAEKDRREADFGLEYSAPNAPAQLTGTVAEVQRDPRGGLILLLSNDQVWQQTGSERLFIDAGDTVFIHRGAMTAFYLSTSANGRRYRFARVR